MERSHIILALLFTDAQGVVIFADGHFLRLFNYTEAGMVVGEPLHQVLHIESQTAAQLLRTIAQTGYIIDMPLSAQSKSGDAMQVLCAGVATYDDRNNFIGADLTLRPSTSAALASHPLTHQDSLSTHIQQVQAQAEALETHDLLKIYLTTQLSALDILLARMGGPRVRKTLNGVALKKAEQLGLPLRMADGDIHIDCGAAETNCTALLQEVANYASSIIGRRMVIDEMRAVDGHMDAHIRDIADHTGLRKILNGQ